MSSIWGRDGSRSAPGFSGRRVDTVRPDSRSEQHVTGRTSAVLVTRVSAGARRQLGPLAWTVLEALLLDVNDDVDGVLVVHTSLRSLACELGLDKTPSGERSPASARRAWWNESPSMAHMAIE
jgi:hypothetical protein